MPRLGKSCVDCPGAIDHDGSEIVCLKCLVEAISQNPMKGGANWAFKVLLRATERPELRTKAIGLARQHFRGRWRGYLDGSDKVKRAMVKTKPPPKPRVIPQIPREPKPEPAAPVVIDEPTREEPITMAMKICERCEDEFEGKGPAKHCDKCIVERVETGEFTGNSARCAIVRLVKRTLGKHEKGEVRARAEKLLEAGEWGQAAPRKKVRTFDDIPTPNTPDEELAAMNAIYLALGPLTPDGRDRALAAAKTLLGME